MKFDFDPNLIDRLGLEMYDNPTRAISELVSNSWDADATVVHIELPTDKINKESVIRVIDDGFGMSKDDVENKFVQIGMNKRIRGEKTPGGRPIKGRKGIGKFAGFGIADVLEIYTVKNGRCFGFSINLNKIRKYKSLKDYDIDILFDNDAEKVPKHIKILQDKKTGKPTGTSLTLKKLRTVERSPNPDRLRESLAMGFRLPPDFKIYVNGTSAKKIEIENQRVIKINEIVKEEIVLENGKKIKVEAGRVKGFIALAKDTVKFSWGVSIIAKGRTVELNTDFNISKGFTGQIYTAYLYGEIEAEWLDRKDKDLIATDRGGIRWDTEKCKALETWGQEKIKAICKEHAKAVGTKKIREWELQPRFTSRIMRFAPQHRQEIEKSIKVIIEKATGTQMEKTIDLMIDLFLLAFENRDVFLLLKKLHETGIKDIKEFSELLEEWSLVEITHVCQVVKGRLELIGMLKDYYESSKTPEKTMQELLETYPWLIHPIYDIIKADKALSETLNEMCKKYFEKEVKAGRLTKEELRKRPDFVCLGALGTYVVVEIKKPKLKAGIKEVQQLEEYVVYVCKYLDKTPPDITGFLIAHDFNEDAKILINQSQSLNRITYKDLWRQAKNLHEEFLKILEKKKDESSKIVYGPLKKKGKKKVIKVKGPPLKKK